MKKIILHVIESLAIGGAEVLLIESLKNISNEYKHILVYLHPPETLLPAVKAHKTYCLGYEGKRNIFSCIIRLRRIIQKEKIDLIHTHNYWPTIIARFAKTKKIPLVFTVHNMLSHDAFKLNRLSLYLEKLSYRKEHHAVFVSEAAMEDYRKYIHLGNNTSVLYNFVSDKFYDRQYSKFEFAKSNSLHLVAVGTLKRQKNFSFLVDVFTLLKDKNIFLDIIGEGPQRSMLQKAISDNGLDKVKLKGASGNVFGILGQYDAFILASNYEGFCLAVIEAMAVGLPCIVSDIITLREVAGDAAYFFDLSSPGDCAKKLVELLYNREKLVEMSDASKKRALQFQKNKYLRELDLIYQQYL